jgi:hypothetical protein
MGYTTRKQQHTFYTINRDIFAGLEQLVHNGNSGVSVIVPHLCNDVDSFGAGFTAAISEKYPQVKDNYHLLGPPFLKKNPGYTQFVNVSEDKKHNNKLIFCNMIAQNGLISHNNPRPINYLSLCRAMLGVSRYAQENFSAENSVQIHAPKFGSGLAGGNWNFISCLIDDIWGKLPVFIYENKKR